MADENKRLQDQSANGKYRKKTVINEDGSKGPSFMTDKDADFTNELNWDENDQLLFEAGDKAAYNKAKTMGILDEVQAKAKANKNEQAGDWAKKEGLSDTLPPAPESISSLDEKGVPKGNQGDNKIEKAGEMDTGAVENAQKNMYNAMTQEERDKYNTEGTGTVEGKPEDYLDEEEKKRLEAEKAAREAREGTTSEETEADPGNTGSATTDAENITKDIPGDKNNRHYRAVKSIWSAYYDGDFGPPGSSEAKEVAWYYTIDSLGKLASNIGRSLRNVGAAYVGGAIDDGEDKSEWQEHRDSLRKEATGMDTENMGGAASRQANAELLRNSAISLQNNRAATVNDLIEEYKRKANEAGNPVSEAVYANIMANLAGAGISPTTQIAGMGAGVLDKAIELISSAL